MRTRPGRGCSPGIIEQLTPGGQSPGGRELRDGRGEKRTSAWSAVATCLWAPVIFQPRLEPLLEEKSSQRTPPYPSSHPFERSWYRTPGVRDLGLASGSATGLHNAPCHLTRCVTTTQSPCKASSDSHGNMVPRCYGSSPLPGSGRGRGLVGEAG